MIKELHLEIVLEEETEEPYYFIKCTNENDTTIEINGFDTIYNTEEEAQVGLNNILNKLKSK